MGFVAKVVANARSDESDDKFAFLSKQKIQNRMMLNQWFFIGGTTMTIGVLKLKKPARLYVYKNALLRFAIDK